MDSNATEQQRATTTRTIHATTRSVHGPVEDWMEIPLVTVTEIVDQEPLPHPQPLSNSSTEEASSSGANTNMTTTRALRGGEDGYDDCCERVRNGEVGNDR
ncbi:hypothetical protein PG994_002069 [Apiospora phragmitis]|uniref:Uncharacterized protein n=1 Tax=Apiospora phragmitis TaxID=2905665 RepID=A0ABR1WVC5_9PEZI